MSVWERRNVSNSYPFTACSQKQTYWVGNKICQTNRNSSFRIWQNSFQKRTCSWNYLKNSFLSIQKCPKNSNWSWLNFNGPWFTRQSIEKAAWKTSFIQIWTGRNIRIIPLAMKMFNIFGRKYICEQIFIKNQKRSCLTKENLGNILKIPTINMSEEYRFVTEKRCHSYIFLWIFSNFSKSRIEIYIILYPNNFRYIRSFL